MFMGISRTIFGKLFLSLGMDTKVYVIDEFDGSEIKDCFLPLQRNNCDVIVLQKEPDVSKGSPQSGTEPYYIFSDTRLGAFYQAKIRIDSSMLSDITFICSKDEGNFWYTVCKELLTPAYTISLKITDDYQPIYDPNVVPEIKKFLSSYATEDEVVILKSNIIDESFNHGFSLRKGGLSTARGVASLNITPASIKRDTDLIGKENIRRLGVKAGFNPDQFVKARAVHGNSVYVVGADEPTEGYDCLVANQRNITVAAPGADCVMMVFADPVTPAFGACHSGWKGTLAKACIETIRKMQDEYGSKPENIKVALGPCIGPCCLEFDAKDAGLFTNINEHSVTWKEGHAKPFIDLRIVNRTLLESFGVLPNHIDDTTLALCTSCNPELFYSYRRDNIPFGNQVGFIGLR